MSGVVMAGVSLASSRIISGKGGVSLRTVNFALANLRTLPQGHNDVPCSYFVDVYHCPPPMLLTTAKRAASDLPVGLVAACIVAALRHVLTDLLEMTNRAPSPTAPVARRPSDNGVEFDNNNGAVQFRMLSDLARIALTSSGGGDGDGGARANPKARSRALALDCLRLGLLCFPDGDSSKAVGFSNALDIAAVGAKDDRWNVRVAAVGVAREALRNGEVGTLPSLLSSKQGCWLPALLVDGYPEVEQAARAALSPVFGCLGDGGDNGGDHDYGRDLDFASTVPPTPSSSSSAPSAVAVASMVMRNACHVLREMTLASHEDEGLVIDSRVTDVGAEATTRTALRALQGGISLLGSPGSPHSSTQQVEVVRVEALETIEAWVMSILADPPVWAAWGTGRKQGAARSVDAPLGDLSVETRDAVQALLHAGTHGVQIAALEAAEEAVDGFRAECGKSLGAGSKEQQEDKEAEEDFWGKCYAGLLVRLEAIAPSGEGAAADKGERNAALSPTFRTTSQRRPSAQHHSEGSAEGTSGGTDRGTDKQRSALARLAGKIAEALNEVPPAHEKALPSFLDDDENMTISRKNALRSLGDRRRRWMVASTQLLLGAGARFCKGGGFSDAATSGAREQSVATVKLLVASMAFQQTASKSDDPTEAWLSCVRPGPLNCATRPAPPSPAAVPAAIAAAATELVTPVPWELCVRRQTLPRHELPARWVGSLITVNLAEELVEAAWGALSLSDSGPVAERSAEMLVQVLRASARGRGWREEGGVGVKHAISATIRRLRFPLVAGVTLGHALPLILPLADDSDPAHQGLGLSLLLHVGLEATPTELAWHRGLLLEVLERGLRGGGRDPSATLLCLAAAVRILRNAPREDASAGSAGIRIAREALGQAGRTSDGVVRVVMVCGAAALLELPATGKGYAACELLRPALLCLLPILQSSPVSASLDARSAALRALNALCLSCWPRVHAHASKLLCALLWTCGDCSRRALARDSAPGGGSTPVGVDVATRSAVSTVAASVDEVVRAHAVKIGALVLLLVGDPARSALRDVCSAVSVLRPAGTTMEQLADSVVERQSSFLGRGVNGIDEGAERSCERGEEASSAVDGTAAAVAV